MAHRWRNLVQRERHRQLTWKANIARNIYTQIQFHFPRAQVFMNINLAHDVVIQVSLRLPSPASTVLFASETDASRWSFSHFNSMQTTHLNY